MSEAFVVEGRYRKTSLLREDVYKVKHILDNNSLHTLYCTLILPYLSYACEIWGNTYPTRFNIVKKAIRIIDKAKYRDHTDLLFSKYNCLKFHDLVNFKTLKIVYKAKHYLLPIHLKICFQKLTMYIHFTQELTKGDILM